ncbi:Meiotic recombination protein dmc1 [Orobanche gracilis]
MFRYQMMFFVHIYEHKAKLLLNLAAKMCEQPFGIQIVDSVIALFGLRTFQEEESLVRMS